MEDHHVVAEERELQPLHPRRDLPDVGVLAEQAEGQDEARVAGIRLRSRVPALVHIDDVITELRDIHQTSIA